MTTREYNRRGAFQDSDVFERVCDYAARQPHHERAEVREGTCVSQDPLVPRVPLVRLTVTRSC